MFLERTKSDRPSRSIKSSKSQKKRPEIVHIRKPSLSDSVSSASSASTVKTSRSGSSHRHTRVIDFDPLNQHPTFLAPPRLSERPFIVTEDQHHYSTTERNGDVEEYIHSEDILERKSDSWPSNPTVDSPTPIQADSERQSAATSRGDEGGDYFLYKLHLVEHQQRLQRQALGEGSISPHTAPATLDVCERPAVNRSRWSESTIATLDLDDCAVSDSEEDDDVQTSEDEDDEDVDLSAFDMVTPSNREFNKAASWQNFSLKTDMSLAPASPRRPPLQTVDSVENFMKRGGWKRKGIVFQKEEARAETSLF